MNSSTDLYYIIDQNNNYYRKSKKKRLIISGCRENANIFEEEIAKSYIEKMEEPEIFRLLPINESLPGDRDLAKIQEKYNIENMDWIKYLTDFVNISVLCVGYKEKLDKQLSQIDLEIGDLLHYIEFTDMNDIQKISFANQLKEARNRRREIKDKREFVMDYMQKIGSQSNILTAKEIINTVKKDNERVYNPRVLDDLFNKEKEAKSENKFEAIETLLEKGITCILSNMKFPFVLRSKLQVEKFNLIIKGRFGKTPSIK